MAITCPHCGAEYDVTLFQFGHGIRCGCGAWVDLESGNRKSLDHAENARLPRDDGQTDVPDERNGSNANESEPEA